MTNKISLKNIIKNDYGEHIIVQEVERSILGYLDIVGLPVDLDSKLNQQVITIRGTY
jgi:hypothetical protein